MPLRVSQISQAVPEASDRRLHERMKELEARGIVSRRVTGGPRGRVEYELTPMGYGLVPAVRELVTWARRWLGSFETRRVSRPDEVGVSQAT